jgi:hypothetical protein
MRTVNIFSSYKQENRFTNGLVALLELSTKVTPHFATSFLNGLLNLDPDGEICTFRVLKRIEGAADAELCGKGFCIRVETKIWSSSLTGGQVRRRLRELHGCKKKIKRLVLLTPDDSNSEYIKQFCDLRPRRILHLEWRRVYDFLKQHQNDLGPVFAEIVDQFLALIHDTVFEQDIVGAILVVAFGDKSGDSETYLTEIADGEPGWTSFNTPQKYSGLDGTGRKLMLYDKTRMAITAVGEIKQVRKTNRYRAFPWTNYFAPGSLHVLAEPIPVKRIRKLDGFEYLGKCQNACWKVTQEEYRELTGQAR